MIQRPRFAVCWQTMAEQVSLSVDDIEKAKDAIATLGRVIASSATVVQGGPSVPDSASSSSRNASVMNLAENALSTINSRLADYCKTKSKREMAGKRKDAAKVELHKLFNYPAPSAKRKKSKHIDNWKHKFVCLAFRDQERIPTTDSEKDELLQAGLGEKEITFYNLNMSAESFRDHLQDHFPQLRDSGGYHLCKCKPNSRELEVLSKFAHSSPEALKQRVGNAKTYIRPLQKDLDLSAVVELPEGPEEQCLSCGLVLPLGQLERHVSECEKSHQVIATVKTEPPSESPEMPGHSPILLDSGDDASEVDFDLPDVQLEQRTTCEIELQAMEEEMISSVMQESRLDAESRRGTSGISHDEASNPLSETIKRLQDKIDSDVPLTVDIRRSNVFEDAMREARKKKFTVHKLLKVTFVGKGALDYGGPRREFFRLLAETASQILFIGNDSCKFFAMNATFLQKTFYYYLGQYVVMSVTQGGCGFPFLATQVYDYLCSGKLVSINLGVKDVPDSTLRFIVAKLQDSGSDAEIQSLVAMDEAQALLFEAGFSKPFSSLTVEDKVTLSNMLLNYHCMVKVKAAMDQFLDGLQFLGLLDSIRKDPATWKIFFVASDVAVDAAYLKKELVFKFSDEGSNALPAEQQAYIYFVDFLDDCDAGEDGIDGCTVKDVLIFLTGSSRIPPAGFTMRPTVVFNHDTSRLLATASTCDLVLRLPVNHQDYQSFKSDMILSIKGHDGFGGP